MKKPKVSKIVMDIIYLMNKYHYIDLSSIPEENKKAQKEQLKIEITKKLKFVGSAYSSIFKASFRSKEVWTDIKNTYFSDI